MYLREFIIQSTDEYDKDTEFSLSVNCISDLFFDCLPKNVYTGDFGKIIINVGENFDVHKTEELNVLQVFYPIDFKKYWFGKDVEKKEYVLIIISEVFKFLSEMYSWDSSVFSNAVSCVKEKKFERKGFYGKKVYSPSKKLKAQLYIEHDIKEIKIYLVVTNVRGKKIELLREYISSVKPYWFFINEELAPINWKSEKEISIKNKINNRVTELSI